MERYVAYRWISYISYSNSLIGHFLASARRVLNTVYKYVKKKKKMRSGLLAVDLMMPLSGFQRVERVCIYL